MSDHQGLLDTEQVLFAGTFQNNPVRDLEGSYLASANIVLFCTTLEGPGALIIYSGNIY
jgi:hypothetical protein